MRLEGYVTENLRTFDKQLNTRRIVLYVLTRVETAL